MNEYVVPKLVENIEKEDSFLVQIGKEDVYLTNIKDLVLDLRCDENSTLKLNIVDPEIDIIIGDYHIKSSRSSKTGNMFTLYNVTNIKTNEELHCQRVRFSGKKLIIEHVIDSKYQVVLKQEIVND